MACYCTPCFFVHIHRLCRNPTSPGVVELSGQEIFIGSPRALLLPAPFLCHLAWSSSSTRAVWVLWEVGENSSARYPALSLSAREVLLGLSASQLKIKQLSQRVPSAALAMSSSSLGWRQIWVTNTMMHVGFSPASSLDFAPTRSSLQCPDSHPPEINVSQEAPQSSGTDSWLPIATHTAYCETPHQPFFSDLAGHSVLSVLNAQQGLCLVTQPLTDTCHTEGRGIPVINESDR